ncbi:MAG: hypothetical protein IJD07_02380, partial [Clostridia bacterium]|nr:hypothetical protein [Clostridia bacterium]
PPWDRLPWEAWLCNGEGEYNSGQMLACVGLEFDHPLLRHKIKISLDEKTAEYLAVAKALDENS